MTGLRHSLTGRGAVTMPIPLEHEIHVEDLAHSIAQIARFGGWLTEQFSVAQHSLEVGRLCRTHVEDHIADVPQVGLVENPDEAELAGLCHDLHEAIVGDQITPAKRRLGETWREHERDAEMRTHRALGIAHVMQRHAELVDWADAEMVVNDVLRWGVPGEYVSKRGNFSVGENMRLPDGYGRWFADARVLPWREARDALLDRYFHLRHCLARQNVLPEAAPRAILPR